MLNIDSLTPPDFVGRVVSTEQTPPNKTRNNSKSSFSRTNYFTFGRHSRENKEKRKSPELSFQMQSTLNLSDP